MFDYMFNSELEFNECMRYFCTKNCAMQILSFYGIEKTIQWISACSKFKICKNPHHIISTTEALEIAPSNTYFLSGYSKRFENSFYINCGQVSDGGFPIVLVDVYYLPYRNEYKKYHASHAVIMCGICEDFVKIIDYYPPHFFKGEISVEHFKFARNSINPPSGNPFSGFPIKNQWYYVEKNHLVDDVKFCIMERNLFELKTFSESGSNDLYVSGCDAIDSILFRIKQTEKNWSCGQMCAFYSELHNALFVFKNSIKLTIAYLKSFDKVNNQLIILLEKLSEVLDKINIASLKSSITRQNITDYLMNLLKQASELFICIQKEAKSL